MKKLILITLIFAAFSSCSTSTMESDAQKACELIAETAELMPEVIQLGLKSSFGDEESKKESRKKLNKVKSKMESMALELAIINKKYNEYEFQAYLSDNCETVKNLKEMGEAFSDSLENN
jgi:hypothetical protein